MLKCKIKSQKKQIKTTLGENDRSIDKIRHKIRSDENNMNNQNMTNKPLEPPWQTFHSLEL